MMGYADSPDPEHPGPDFLANPPSQQPGPPRGSRPAPPPAAPYGQRPDHQAQPYAPMPQNTTPSWQVPPLYGAHPQLGGPKRPGPAAAAAVLGIIGGSLGLFPAIIVLLAAVKVHETESTAGSANITFIILFTLGLATTVTVITLLVTGITFLKGKGYAVLLSAVTAQLALAALYVAIMLLALDSIIQSMRNRSSETGVLVIIIFCILIGLGMAVSNLVLLCRPATRQWAKQVP
jgi:hypothetical protein